MKKTVTLALVIGLGLLAGQAMAERPEGQGRHAPAQAQRGPGRLLKQADSNHDGAISKEEFRAVSDKRFNRLDTNGDGKISQAEIEQRRKEFEARRSAALQKRAERAGAGPREKGEHPAGTPHADGEE